MIQRQMPPHQYPMYMQQPPYQNPMMGMNQMPPKRQGMLSKLFGKKNQPPQDMYYMMNNPAPFMPMQQMPQMNPNPPQMYPNPPQMNQRMTNPQPMERATNEASSDSSKGVGNFLSNFLSNPSSMMGNVEKIMQVAQTMKPVVEQYGPLMKSIPGIGKIFTTVAAGTEATVIEGEATDVAPEPKAEEKAEKKTLNHKQEQPAPTPQNHSIQEKTSGPKLYV
ncbi:VrrA/YqfQ family protein [Microbacteriaceae bacterium 4G12]